jgi:protein-S-isoprenylcysteine O-methyltransferase Ste14
MLFAGYVLLAVYIAAELLAREDPARHAVGAAEDDERTPQLLIGAYALALLLAPALEYLDLGTLPLAPLWGTAGALLMLGGIALRAWAAIALGPNYSRSLRVVQGQRVIQDGPYWLVRHPVYLSSLLAWVGFGVLLANWLITPVIAAMMAVAYLERIHTEEALLLRTFGSEYSTYMHRTWRLLPGVY